MGARLDPWKAADDNPYTYFPPAGSTRGKAAADLPDALRVERCRSNATQLCADDEDGSRVVAQRIGHLDAAAGEIGGKGGGGADQADAVHADQVRRP